MTDPTKLTTDPPRPPGTPDVDDLVGDPVPSKEAAAPRTEPEDEDVTEAEGDEDRAADTVSVEPPD